MIIAMSIMRNYWEPLATASINFRVCHNNFYMRWVSPSRPVPFIALYMSDLIKISALVELEPKPTKIFQFLFQFSILNSPTLSCPNPDPAFLVPD